MIRIILFTIISIYLLLNNSIPIAAQQSRADEKVQIVAFMGRDYDEYRMALEGFKEELERSNIRYEIQVINSLGDNPGETEVLHAVQQKKPALILALGTKAANFISSQVQDIPIIYSMVLNQRVYGQSNSVAKNITGVTLSIPTFHQFSVIKEIMPDVKSIGVIYTRAENADLIQEAQLAARQLNIDLVTAGVDKEKEVPTALNNLLRVVDVIWMIVDKAVNSVDSRKYIILECFRNNVPVVGLSENYVRAGAAFAVSADYTKLGIQTGTMAVKILNGSEVRMLSHESPKDYNIYINQRIVDGIGLIIPENIEQRVIVTSN